MRSLLGILLLLFSAWPTTGQDKLYQCTSDTPAMLYLSNGNVYFATIREIDTKRIYVGAGRWQGFVAVNQVQACRLFHNRQTLTLINRKDQLIEVAEKDEPDLTQLFRSAESRLLYVVKDGAGDLTVVKYESIPSLSAVKQSLAPVVRTKSAQAIRLAANPDPKPYGYWKLSQHLGRLSAVNSVSSLKQFEDNERLFADIRREISQLTKLIDLKDLPDLTPLESANVDAKSVLKTIATINDDLAAATRKYDKSEAELLEQILAQAPELLIKIGGRIIEKKLTGKTSSSLQSFLIELIVEFAWEIGDELIEFIREYLRHEDKIKETKAALEVQYRLLTITNNKLLTSNRELQQKILAQRRQPDAIDFAPRVKGSFDHCEYVLQLRNLVPKQPLFDQDRQGLLAVAVASIPELSQLEYLPRISHESNRLAIAQCEGLVDYLTTDGTNRVNDAKVGLAELLLREGYSQDSAKVLASLPGNPEQMLTADFYRRYRRVKEELAQVSVSRYDWQQPVAKDFAKELMEKYRIELRVEKVLELIDNREREFKLDFRKRYPIKSLAEIERERVVAVDEAKRLKDAFIAANEATYCGELVFEQRELRFKPVGTLEDRTIMCVYRLIENKYQFIGFTVNVKNPMFNSISDYVKVTQCVPGDLLLKTDKKFSK